MDEGEEDTTNYKRVKLLLFIHWIIFREGEKRTFFNTQIFLIHGRGTKRLIYAKS